MDSLTQILPVLEAFKLPVEIAGVWVLFTIQSTLRNHGGRLVRIEKELDMRLPKELRQ